VHDLTHASFFSGVGGLDLGLERAGWRTVSFSEIDPYASAVLARHWPGVPNLGDITDIAGGWQGEWGEEQLRQHADRADWTHATLWSGGFPCQDLSVAGKRVGFGIAHERPRHHGTTVSDPADWGERDGRAPGRLDGIGRGVDAGGTRSGLAFAFLDLVERYRPPAFLLENVAGLLSSHGGRDMATLLGTICDLGYGVAYRTYDARFFGVPQRRRRVFILGLRSDPDDPDGRVAAERAAAILSVGTRCERHPPTGGGKGKGAADEPRDGSIGTFTAGAHPGSYNGQDAYTGHLIPSPPPDSGGVRASHGLARRVDDRAGVEVVQALDAKRGEPDDNEAQAGHLVIGGGGMTDDPLLPPGLDSARYRTCGNGVVAPVAEWLGRRLAEGLS
jgi:DNA (cytosine-5)-methyltransferase 1